MTTQEILAKVASGDIQPGEAATLIAAMNANGKSATDQFDSGQTPLGHNKNEKSPTDSAGLVKVELQRVLELVVDLAF